MLPQSKNGRDMDSIRHIVKTTCTVYLSVYNYMYSTVHVTLSVKLMILSLTLLNISMSDGRERQISHT